MTYENPTAHDGDILLPKSTHKRQIIPSCFILDLYNTQKLNKVLMIYLGNKLPLENNNIFGINYNDLIH